MLLEYRVWWGRDAAVPVLKAPRIEVLARAGNATCNATDSTFYALAVSTLLTGAGTVAGSGAAELQHPLCVNSAAFIRRPLGCADGIRVNVPEQGSPRGPMSRNTA